MLFYMFFLAGYHNKHYNLNLTNEKTKRKNKWLIQGHVADT